jgi:putative SOS response-associated peptidase YedK
MCANYRPVERGVLETRFYVPPPDSDFPPETFPGYMARFIRPPHADSMPGDRACALGMFGLVPHWAKDETIARNTYNARDETVAEKPSFRNAFKRRQFCIIPVTSIYEPCYETGKAVRWEIAAADGAPLGLAGIWEYKQHGPNGLPLLSFSMLTINADYIYPHVFNGCHVRATPELNAVMQVEAYSLQISGQIFSCRTDLVAS